MEDETRNEEVRPNRPIRFGRIVLGLLLLSPVLAPSSISGQTLRSFSLHADNDGFVFWKPPHERTDWYYTNGLVAEAVLHWAPSIARILGDQAASACPRNPEPGPCGLTRVKLGQAIYTPASLFSTAPPVQDRPYAGWLFVGVTAARVTGDGATSLGIEMGVTGGPSLAGPVHRWFHRTLGKYEPQGWEHQIPFELAFSMKYEARRAWPLFPSGGGPSLHIEPRGALELGTLRTGAVAGLLLNAGWNSPPSFDWLRAGSGPFHALVGVGAEGELVLRDLFLDGSTWGPSVRTERVPVVGRVLGRIQAGWKGIALEFSAIRSTNQFKEQKGAHTVGVIRLILYP